MSRVVVDDESRLEERALEGDPVAFGQLLRQFDQQLRSVVWSVVGRQVSVDDVMQTAYEKAFRSIGEFDGRSSMKTWLHTICYRTALDQIRYEKRRRHEDMEAMSDIASAHSTAASALSSVEIENVFALLSPEHRVVMMLVAGLGHTVDEAANILGMKRGTVASRLGRARSLLRKENLA